MRIRIHSSDLQDHFVDVKVLLQVAGVVEDEPAGGLEGAGQQTVQTEFHLPHQCPAQLVPWPHAQGPQVGQGLFTPPPVTYQSKQAANFFLDSNLIVKIRM